MVGPCHPLLETIRGLRRRNERERSGRYYVEGLRCVARAVAERAAIEALIVCPQLLVHPYALRLAALLRRRGVPVLAVTEEALAGITFIVNREGIGALLRQRWEPLDSVRPGEELCWIALERLQSPGNLGAILRTSEAVGGAGLILLGDDVDPYDPAAVRAAMGASLAQRYVRSDIDALARWKREHGALLVGTSPRATEQYHRVAYRAPTVLLLGWERQGLSREVRRQCDLLVRIPMVGPGDSLNVAVAAGILLYELVQQRHGRAAAGGTPP